MPLKDRAAHRAYMKAYYRDQSPEERAIKNRVAWLCRYGLTLETFDVLLISQAGRCALCGDPMMGRSPSVDHDHKTGKVRGLLHQRCNIAVGFVETRPGLLDRVANYLEAYRG